MSGDNVFEELLDELRRAAEKPGGSEFTRPNVLQTLRIIARHLEDALLVDVSEIEPGVWMSYTHVAPEHLHLLAEAISDLDRGIVCDMLRLGSIKKLGAARAADLRDRDRVLCETLLIYKAHHGITHLNKAARRLAKELGKNGYRRKGALLTGLSLLRIFNSYDKSWP